MSDDAMQTDLINQGGAGIMTELQADAPVTFIHARHDADDMLGAATVLNQSQKAVVSIRFGWTIKSPNQPDENKLGNWVPLAKGLGPGSLGNIPAQKIDPAPLHRAGALVKIYIAEVKFQDGSIWERPKTRKAELKENNV